MTFPYDVPQDFIEWQASQEVVKGHPDTLAATRHLVEIVHVLNQYRDGLVTSIEAVVQIHQISKR